MYEQYTDKQIVEMLVPKLNKAVPEGYWDEAIKHPELNRNFIKAVATIYRSGYIRGELGRSFIIGEPKQIEPKCTERWVPVNSNNVKKGDSVRYIGKNGHKNSPEYYPAKDVVGKVIKVCSDLTCHIQWPKGSTSRNDRWYASWCNLEVLLCE